MSSTIIPTFRCKDAIAEIKWLCDTFGFKEKVCFKNDEGMVVHALLTFGNAMIMLSEAHGNEYDKLTRSPLDVGGVTQSAYLIVNDVKAYYKMAIKAKAPIVQSFTEEAHGAGFSCADPEGQIWNFGDYNPWTAYED